MRGGFDFFGSGAAVQVTPSIVLSRVFAAMLRLTPGLPDCWLVLAPVVHGEHCSVLALILLSDDYEPVVENED